MSGRRWTRAKNRPARVAAHRRAARRALPCPICALPADTRALLDLALREGASPTWIAAHFGTTRGQLRHHHSHQGGTNDEH